MLNDSFLFRAFVGRCGNKILVTDELPDGQMVDQWEKLSIDSVKTPLEVISKFCIILTESLLISLLSISSNIPLACRLVQLVGGWCKVGSIGKRS